MRVSVVLPIVAMLAAIIGSRAKPSPNPEVGAVPSLPVPPPWCVTTVRLRSFETTVRPPRSETTVRRLPRLSTIASAEA
jgi:hypothetical protein